MYNLSYSTKFKKDIKLCQKRKYDFSLFKQVIELLEEHGSLPLIYKPHILSGDYSKHWECHIKPNWLLIWTQDDINKKSIWLEQVHILICFKNRIENIKSPLTRNLLSQNKAKLNLTIQATNAIPPSGEMTKK